ncbi:hypothetical protein BpHYR1_046555, partial [Brachionus plicatilis]
MLRMRRIAGIIEVDFNRLAVFLKIFRTLIHKQISRRSRLTLFNELLSRHWGKEREERETNVKNFQSDLCQINGHYKTISKTAFRVLLKFRTMSDPVSYRSLFSSRIEKFIAFVKCLFGRSKHTSLTEEQIEVYREAFL